MPAPQGNQNAVKHGLRMATNSLPKGCARIRRERNQMRTALEGAVLAVHGTISVYRAAVIQTASRWATHAALCARWLRLADSNLPHGERLNYSREVARASSERDKCIQALGLDEAESERLRRELYSGSQTVEWQQPDELNDEARQGHHEAARQEDSEAGA